ncbi:Protein ROOT PRIMORDIUM DEFECTIVE like [Actinidia chinensis var. chinensis]|uniref:Protein ROOT PRIMORDIUM DEFECTIVE like n=1 Tax=Actinidia chinensis var. chinensis TaxID=1590841 RepID=A0A2R6PM64_ACTCC|nr:Protein ROOT PRIMORDIUM DEFECTIVE like [Actinidia chinensis var. chinensis]
MRIIFIYTTKICKPNTKSFTPTSLIPSILRATPTNTFTPTRPMSQSVAIPKKLQRVRDHGYDDYMEVEKKMRKVLKFQDLILSQPTSVISISRLDTVARRLGLSLKQFEAGRFVLKFPHVFEIFEHPVQRILYCRLTRKAQLQIDGVNEALIAQIPDAVTRLRKLLMLSNTGRLQLEHVRIARKDFGLPDDFEFSVILKYPQFFRLFDAKECRSKYVEIVERDPKLTVCAIERLREREYREKGIDAEDIRFSFIVRFPPGFKIGKYYKIAVWKWQRVPYWSPYDDISGYDLRSLEAQKRMEKRAVAMIHELLSLTVEKKITLERIAHFRLVMNLPKKLKDFLLQHQGIFYISTRGNHGKLHTVFLREAYKKGELIEPNDLYLARRKLAELILLSPKKAYVDRELVRYRRGGEDNEMRNFNRDYAENSFSDFETEANGRHDGEGEDKLQSDLDCDSEPDYTDEDTDSEEGGDVGATRVLGN